MKAMILAAGKGTRLGNLTLDKPKVLMEINGKSILRYVVEKCTIAGFDDIIVNVHHLASMVLAEVEKLRNLGFNISISDESELLLETGGGLYKARDFFGNQPFLLYNSDILTDLDLGEMFSFHKLQKALATLAVRNRRGNRFFLVNTDGLLRGWINKSTDEIIYSGPHDEELHEIAFSGIHIIEPEIFRYMQDGIYTMTSLYLKLAQAYPIQTFRYDTGYWFDIGTLEKLYEARNFLLGKSQY